MSSPGLLFLLLVSSCLSVLSAPPGTSLDNEEPDQEDQCQNKFRSWLKKHSREIAEAITNTIETVPVAGPPIAAAVNNAMLLTPEADVVNSELKALSVKLDIFYEELKWEAWAAGAYQMPVNNIEKAWIKYTELMHGYQQTTNNEKESLKTEFVTFYSQYVDSTLVLHQFLTAKPVSMIQNLGDLLADRLRCHEKDVKAQFLYLNKLMCKGTMLNEKYYGFKGITISARINEIVSQSAQALMTSHQRCISDSAAYIKKDIFERIDDTREHKQIANNIREFLAKTYDRYDWEVVAFTTQNSKHMLKVLNRHNLLGFTETERGTVTVAVAKQVKGGATKKAAVTEAIKKCLPEDESCLDVIQKLKECQETVFGKPLSQTYTAVHAYKRNSQSSTNVVKEPNDEDSPPNPHVLIGKCGKFLGKYIILIKSDEEIMGVDPCSKEKCGQNGKCVIVPGTFIAMCKCEYPYYGDHCEMSFESYKRDLQNSMSVSPDNRRFQQSTSQLSSNGGSQQRASRRSSSSRSRPSTPQLSSNGGSQQRASRRSSSSRSRPSTPQLSSNGRSQQRASRRSSSSRSRPSTPQLSSNGGSQQRASRRSSSSRSRQSTQQLSSNGGSQQRASRRSSSSRSRQSATQRSSSTSASQRSSNRRSRKSSSQRSLSSRSPKRASSRCSAKRLGTMIYSTQCV